jgi:hypothetical protein
MKDYITLGSCPYEEEDTCAQTTDDNYLEKLKKELQVYKNMLERLFSNKLKYSGVYLKIKTFPHDFGSYSEVCAIFDDENEKQIEVVYDMDRNVPSNWDKIAMSELQGEKHGKVSA